MTTKEFIEKVNDFGFKTREDHNLITILDGYGVSSGSVCTITEGEYFIYTSSSIFRHPQDLAKLVQTMFEYSNTPLADRHEREPLYRLKTSPGVIEGYLAKNLILGNYYISDSCTPYDRLQKEFTLAEIIAMPFDTKFFEQERCCNDN